MTVSANRQLDASPGEHACLFYDDPEEQLLTLLPFIHDGLVKGERCIYFIDDLSLDAVRRSMAAFGIDVRVASQRGALSLWTRQQWRQPGMLDSASGSPQVLEIIKRASASGFAGVRLALQMTWILAPEFSQDRLRHWEATLDTLEPSGIPVNIICQYSRRRLPPAALEAGLNAHLLAIIDAERYANPYFAGPEVSSGNAGWEAAESGSRVDRMLSLLQRKRLMEDLEPRRRPGGAASHAAELYGLARFSDPAPIESPGGREEALSLVSHELRTPVATILGSAQVLAKLDGALAEEERAASVAAIVKEATRLGQVLDDLFVLAHVEGWRQLLVEPVALRHVIRQHLQIHERRHPERPLSLVSEPSEPAVSADPSYIAQILTNLLDNAERHSPPATPILVVTALEGRYVSVRVIDQGPRVEPEDRELIFAAFLPSLPGSRRGLGAGLAATKRLVEAHGGRIWTGSHDNGGMEFGFTLPTATEGDEDGE